MFLVFSFVLLRILKIRSAMTNVVGTIAPRQVIGSARPFACGKILWISKAEQILIKIYKTATELINDVHPLCLENSRTIAAQNHTAPVLLFESKLYRACSTSHGPVAGPIHSSPVLLSGSTETLLYEL